MDELDPFQHIVSRAREERPPRVHVVQSVMRDIPGRPKLDVVLVVFSGASMVAASIFALMAHQSWSIMQDPTIELLQSLQLVFR